jgi:hypothetical protein
MELWAFLLIAIQSLLKLVKYEKKKKKERLPY